MSDLVLGASSRRPDADAPANGAGQGARPRAVLRSVLSMTGVNVVKALVSVLVSFAVARHAPPGEYGLVAFSVPLLALVTLLTDLGIASAIVRETSLDARAAGAAVTLMGLAGLAGGTALLASAYPLAHTLAMPGLGPVLALFGAVAALSIWAAAPRALLERRYAYELIAAVELGGLALGVVAFLLLAGRIGILSLVAYQVVLQAVRAAAFLSLARNLFRPSRRLGLVTSLVRTGGSVLGTNLLAFGARNLDNLLVGAWLGPAALGLYGLAYQFMTIPLTLLTWPASGVLLSTLSRLGHDRRAQAGATVALLAGTAALSFPAMTFLALDARTPLALLYGGRWTGLDAIVAVFAPVGALQSIAAYGGAVLLATGRIRLNLGIGVLNGVALCGLFLVAVPFGLHTVVIAYAVVASLLSAVYVVATCRSVAIGPRHLAAALAPGLAASVAGSLALFAARIVAPPGLAGWLLAAIAFGCGAASGLLATRFVLLDATRTLIGLGRTMQTGEGSDR